MADQNRTVSEARPVALPEGTVGVNVRSNGYGESGIIPFNTERNALAKEGSYYSAINATIDTTVAYGVMAAYAVLTPAFHIANTSLKRTIYLDFLKLRVTVAPASATNWKYVVDVDTSPRLSTAPTGGVALGVNNVNPSFANDFEGKVYGFSGGTVLTIMGATNVRSIYHGAWAESIPVVLDEMILAFGQGDNLTNSVTTVGKRMAAVGPVAIPPGCSASVHMYGASNAITGMSAEYSLGLWQR